MSADPAFAGATRRGARPLDEGLRFTPRLHGVQPGVIGVRDRGRCHAHAGGAMTAPRITSSSVDRRRFLEYVWWGAGSAMAMALMPGGSLKAAPRFATNPFTLGVASGDPTASGIVLWTRLAPEPADPTALGQTSIPVGWRVARDDAMRRVVAKGKASATPELAHSVHAEVKGLRPGADYFYQFDAGGEESAVGHFRTAPAPRRMGAPALLRRRHLPGRPERLLHGVPRHGPERPRPRAPPR